MLSRKIFANGVLICSCSLTAPIVTWSHTMLGLMVPRQSHIPTPKVDRGRVTIQADPVLSMLVSVVVHPGLPASPWSGLMRSSLQSYF